MITTLRLRRTFPRATVGLLQTASCQERYLGITNGEYQTLLAHPPGNVLQICRCRSDQIRACTPTSESTNGDITHMQKLEPSFISCEESHMSLNLEFRRNRRLRLSPVHATMMMLQGRHLLSTLNLCRFTHLFCHLTDTTHFWNRPHTPKLGHFQFPVIGESDKSNHG